VDISGAVVDMLAQSVICNSDIVRKYIGEQGTKEEQESYAQLKLIDFD
jgi:hypothetical protein